MYMKVPKAPRTDMYTATLLTAGNFVHVTMPTRQTHIMSILNTTPDSFSDGGSNALDPQSLRETAAAHIAAGATIIDVGGQSSRPNAPDVTAEEEINRVLPAIAAIRSLPEAKGIAISVDTYRAAVAEAAVNAGADIVNDISAGKMDPQMLQTVARLGCTYVMMHMRGTPATMQNPENCEYAGGLGMNIGNELLERIDDATKAGVRKWRLILDPGIGFAKTQEQNLALLSTTRTLRYPDIKEFKRRTKGMPWLVGSSRKGFIGKITGVTEPKDRVWGTAVAVAASIRGGADIVRVHDVKEMAQVAKMADALYRQKRDFGPKPNSDD
jgi:dihydropteroate synthase